MRGFLMLLLGGGLLWLVISNFGSERAAEAGEGGELGQAEGHLMERPQPSELAREPSSAASEPSSGPKRGPERGPDRGTERGPESGPERGQPGGASAASPAPASTWTPPDKELTAVLAGGGELDLARTLLHRRRDLVRFLKEEGAGLADARKNLALAFALAIDRRPDQGRIYAAKLGEGSAVSSRERELLQLALERRQSGLLSASAGGENALTLAVRMALLSQRADELVGAGSWAEAARAYSALLLEETAAGWGAERQALADWSRRLHEAQEHHRWNPAGDWPALEIRVESGDSLTRIRKRAISAKPGLLLCTGLIDRANGLGGRYLQPGQVLRMPTDPVTTLVDLEAHWLFYMMGGEVVAAWEVGVGQPGMETRPGSYVVSDKIEEPAYMPVGSEHFPYGHPENPLGSRWLGWNTPSGGGSGGLGFHGTNDPDGVGGDVSKGCVRLHNEHIEVLFKILPRDSSILVRS